ncbi:MAG: DUF1648 domain-containing protein [Actinomycetia bacterium]|nr:DUF1648 domain-containing protein [Actinomycetes bacterium]
MNEKMRRLALGAGIPLAVAAVGLGPYLANRSELPDRVAVHYDSAGRPDGSMGTEVFLLVIGGVMAIGLIALMSIALTRRRFQPMVASGVSSMGAFVATLFAGSLALTAIEQRGLDRWQDATLSPITVIAWIGGSILIAGLAAWIASSLPFKADTGTGAVPPSMTLAPGERVFWSSTLTARWPLPLSMVPLAVALAVARFVEPWVVLLLLVAAVALASFGRIRVTADRSGLQVRYGFLGWPRTSVPIHRIANAQAIDVRPVEWGGWGYRGSLAVMRRAAVVLRAGPGLRLDLHNGKVFAVTIDDPDEPARLLNAEVARLPTAQIPLA